MTSEQPRRRLLIGEAVAVAGLIVAGLSLYLGWSERREDKAEHDAEQAESRQAESVQRSRIGLVATDADGEVLSFKGVACALQSADIRFPEALGVPAQNTALSSRIEADWFDEQLLEVLGPAKVELSDFAFVTSATGVSGVVAINGSPPPDSPCAAGDLPIHPAS